MKPLSEKIITKLVSSSLRLASKFVVVSQADRKEMIRWAIDSTVTISIRDAFVEKTSLGDGGDRREDDRELRAHS